MRFGDFAAHQEPGKSRHFPNFAVNLRGGVDHAELDIGPDIEDGDFDCADIALDGLYHRHHRLFIARIGGIGLRLVARIADRLRQCFQSVGMARATVDASRITLGGKGARDCAAGCVTGPDDQGGPFGWRCCSRFLKRAL